MHFVKERAARRVKDIESAVFRERVPLGPLRFHEGDMDGGEFPELDDSGWTEVGVGHSWQAADASAWFRGRVTVPDGWADERVGLWIDIDGAEPLLYLDGRAAQALDYNHQDVLLHDPATGGETHALAVDAYAPSCGVTMTLRAADLVRIDRNAQSLFHDFSVALELLDVLPETTPAHQGALVALDGAMVALDDTEGTTGDAFYRSLPAARKALRREFFDRFPASETTDPAVLLCGQSHIDVAWLWTLANTRKKMGRTTATALRLMDEFPDYTFTQSQPVLYQFLKENHPYLYARVRERVAEGRWEITGGLWVEPDCNVPSGESLIRQALFGQRFFRGEFGKMTRVAWLPDVFGFPASLPQILRGCGMDGFLTTKLGWNQFNKMPHDTFLWRGIDGTGILTHFVAGLNHQMTAKEISGLWSSYKDKPLNHEVMSLFGHGDGGGGPTRAMLEAGRRFASVAGLPRCAFGPAEPFFERLRRRVAGNPRTPRWDGELYLEYHRGTLTSQGRTKRANRRAEVLYHNAELFSALALVELERPYPQNELNNGWEKLLLNQFHDILPGSSISQVYRDAARDYAGVERIGGETLNAALDALAAQIDVRRDSVVLFNPTDTLRLADVAVVTIPDDPERGTDIEIGDENGAPLPAQLLRENPGDATRTYLVSVPEVGSLGYQTLTVYKAAGPPEGSTVSAAVSPLSRSVGTGPGVRATLENDFVRVLFDDAGEIVSLVHKVPADDDPDDVTEREVIADGQTGNALTVFEDKPLDYDAWDIDLFYEDKPYPLRDIGTVKSITVVENGPVRAGLEIRRQFLKSSLTQRVYVYAHSPRVEFGTDVDWQERQMLLKTAFPVQVNAARATYDIQFGAVERPTHRNTSWDLAKFEVCGHKWADLSEGDYGVSLLSDSKYGYDIHDNVLRLTLLKGAVAPDPDADRGRHTFTYALLPHNGDWRMETVDEAYALNYPLLTRFVSAGTRGGGLLPTRYAFASVDDTRVIIETIKKAEDTDDILVRLYEAMNTRGTATLTLGFELAAAFSVNLIEDDPTPVPFTRNRVTFAYRPFEIRTFLLKPRR